MISKKKKVARGAHGQRIPSYNRAKHPQGDDLATINAESCRWLCYWIERVNVFKTKRKRGSLSLCVASADHQSCLEAVAASPAYRGESKGSNTTRTRSTLTLWKPWTRLLSRIDFSLKVVVLAFNNSPFIEMAKSSLAKSRERSSATADYRACLT